MADPYWRYAGDTGSSIPRPSFPGYLPSEPLTLPIHHVWNSSDLRSSASDFLHKDVLASRPGAYGADDMVSIGVRPETVIGGYSAAASIRGYTSPLDDPILLGRRDAVLGTAPTPGIPDLISERPESLRKADGLPAATRESNVLFVDGLPNDCSRREVSHLFRPFIGFREIRVVHKEPRRTGDKAMVLCFVEFSDSKCALTALEALQGYKFDSKKPESAALKIHFAHFPFRLPSDGEESRFTATR